MNIILERLIGVLKLHYPRALLAICCTFVACGIFTLVGTLMITSEENQCRYSSISPVFKVAAPLLTFIAPFFILFVGSCLIRKKQNKTVTEAGHVLSPAQRQRLARKRGLTKSLMWAAMVFLALTSPLHLFKFYMDVKKEILLPGNSPVWLIGSVALFLHSLNSAVNIFLYAARGAEIRQQIIKLGRMVWARNSSVPPAQQPAAHDQDLELRDVENVQQPGYNENDRSNPEEEMHL